MKILVSIFVMFFSILSVQLYADTPTENAKKIIDKSEASSNTQNTYSSFNIQLKTLKNKMLKLDPTSNTNTMCEVKKEMYNVWGDMTLSIAPFLYFLVIIIIIYIIFLFFIKDYTRGQDTRQSGVIKGIFYSFLVMFLINISSVVEVWKKKIVENAYDYCVANGGAAGNGLMLSIVEYVLVLFFTLVQFFGVIIIAFGIYDITKKDTQGDKSNIINGVLKILGGALLLSYEPVLSWFGIF